MPRKRMLLTFKEALARGPYDEFPVLPEEVDPQLHLSRNDRAQPFFLECGKDTVIVQMSGTGQVEFRDASVNVFDLEPGDHVYVPAGTLHRLLPADVSITYRYRARLPGPERLIWLCERCGSEVFRHAYDGDAIVVQLAYADGCDAFNAEPRTCGNCGTTHPPVDVRPYRWREVAADVASAPVPPEAIAHG